MSAENLQYRHELKYYLNRGMYTLLHQKLKHTMEPDEHAKGNGGEYFIRSLYFDDIDDTAFRTKLAGADNRDKIRIRIYNMRDDVIKLEDKHKKDSYIQKSSLSLTREECDSLLEGKCDFLLQHDDPFARRMFALFTTRRMLPRVIVDYTREPYVFSLEDVRVTFDKDIRTGLRSTALFDPKVITYPVTDYDMVMEVKFNRYLPTYIRSLLQADSFQQSAISKYCLCRKYEL